MVLINYLSVYIVSHMCSSTWSDDNYGSIAKRYCYHLAAKHMQLTDTCNCSASAIISSAPSRHWKLDEHRTLFIYLFIYLLLLYNTTHTLKIIKENWKLWHIAWKVHECRRQSLHVSCSVATKFTNVSYNYHVLLDVSYWHQCAHMPRAF